MFYKSDKYSRIWFNRAKKAKEDTAEYKCIKKSRVNKTNYRFSHWALLKGLIGLLLFSYSSLRYRLIFSFPPLFLFAFVINPNLI